MYYSVRGFPDYGKLSRRNLDDLRAGERVAVGEAKRDPLDFALWKSAKPGEPSWPAVFGAGRPGWHIECSAMSCRELGAPFDIHGGGYDLQFPHHENEIAQSEGALGGAFVNLWMHSAFLNIDREKMSKSLGNFHTTRAVLDKLDAIQGGEQLRFFLLRGHYRNEASFTFECRWTTPDRPLRGFYTTLREVPAEHAGAIDWDEPHAQRFRAAMDDDFDTPIAFSVLHELRGEVNRTRSGKLAGLLRALGRHHPGVAAGRSRDLHEGRRCRRSGRGCPGARASPERRAPRHRGPAPRARRRAQAPRFRRVRPHPPQARRGRHRPRGQTRRRQRVAAEVNRTPASRRGDG